jgi:hypothetical protein
MYRAAVERQRALKTARNYGHLTGRYSFGREQCVNRFRKSQKQLGCGKSRCFVCHAEKILDRPTMKERAQREREREWL